MTDIVEVYEKIKYEFNMYIHNDNTNEAVRIENEHNKENEKVTIQK